jgi:hypothetical protein
VGPTGFTPYADEPLNTKPFLVGGLVSLGDTPVAFFPELVAWLPDTKVILTLRDAKKWWKSRVEHHAGDLMCAEHMWQQVTYPPPATSFPYPMPSTQTVGLPLLYTIF